MEKYGREASKVPRDKVAKNFSNLRAPKRFNSKRALTNSSSVNLAKSKYKLYSKKQDKSELS